MKTYLKRTFLDSKETGRKQSAVDVCHKMKTLRDGTGRKMFNKEAWLAADQIARFFSRLSVMHRSGRRAIDQADPSPAQDEEEDFVAEAEEISTRLAIRRQLELAYEPGGRGRLQPPQLRKIFGQNALDSGKDTWEKAL